MSKQMKLMISAILCMTFMSDLIAQQTLNLETSVAEALENNYGIKLAELQETAVKNEIYKGNAGLTPTIDYNFNFTGNLNQVNQVFFDDRKINRPAQSFGPNTNVTLTWTLYDGRRMQSVYQQLKTQGIQSEIQSKVMVQNTTAAVIQAYYEILKQKRSVSFLNTIIGYYNDRLSLTEQRWQIGRGSKLDYLQSKTDLTAQNAELVTAQNALKNAKVTLNRLLGADPTRAIEVEDVSELKKSYDLEELINQAKSQNLELTLNSTEQEINALLIDQAESFRLPRIGINSAFGYSFNRNTAGLLLLNQNTGLSAGVSASWNIFNGHQTKRNIEAAKIQLEIKRKEREQLINNITSAITSTYYQYLTDQELYTIEIENKDISEENLKISLEKFKLGASTILELNEAQRRFDQSLNRLVNAEYNARISELELLRLSGQLIK